MLKITNLKLEYDKMEILKGVDFVGSKNELLKSNKLKHFLN